MNGSVSDTQASPYCRKSCQERPRYSDANICRNAVLIQKRPVSDSVVINK